MFQSLEQDENEDYQQRDIKELKRTIIRNYIIIVFFSILLMVIISVVMTGHDDYLQKGTFYKKHYITPEILD